MKKIEVVPALAEIIRTRKHYLLVVSTYSRAEQPIPQYFKGSGIEAVEKIKEIFDYKGWLEEVEIAEEHDSLETFSIIRASK